MAVPTSELWGIRAPKIRFEHRNAVNPTWVSKDQGRPIQLNRVDYDRTSGSCIGVQIGPNATVLTTHDIIGAEIRARSSVGTGALIAVKGEPNAASSSAGLTALRSFEANITGKGTRTISADVSALRAFLDVDSTVTVTGKKSVIVVATPNVSGWDYLADMEASAGMVVAAAVGGSQSHKIRVRSGGTEFFIPLHTA